MSDKSILANPDRASGKREFAKAQKTRFGLGDAKMDELIALYKSKAMELGMWYDEEAIAAIYRRGYQDGLKAPDTGF